MRPVSVLILVLSLSPFEQCHAQAPSGPFSNAKSIWETESTAKRTAGGTRIIENSDVRAQQAQALPVQHNAASRAILPASFEQKQTAEQNTLSTKTTSANRPVLPLRKPGEKLSLQDKEKTANKKRLGSTSQQLGTTTLVLGGIVAMILFVSRLMKKHTRLGTMNLSSEVLEVLGRKMLDSRHAIHYVLCGNRILVLGTSLEGMRTLAEITDPVEIDRIRGECKPIPVDSKSGTSFGFLLSKAERETEQVNLDKQHRKRQKKRSRTRTRSKSLSQQSNQPPAPDLADFGLNLDAIREGRP